MTTTPSPARLASDLTAAARSPHSTPHESEVLRHVARLVLDLDTLQPGHELAGARDVLDAAHRIQERRRLHPPRPTWAEIADFADAERLAQ